MRWTALYLLACTSGILLVSLVLIPDADYIRRTAGGVLIAVMISFTLLAAERGRRR